MAIVETRSGKVEGFERDGVQVFRGIPYAAPPVGPLRWQPPRREEPWSGTRDATSFSAQSAQTEFALAKMMGEAKPPCREDSLYLNVWTPACDDARRPVMVWIHGGAFIWGAGDTPWYDGTKFAVHGDVVVVTINYRLGPFGFLHLADLFDGAFAGSGNAGISDQIAALEWVRDCIAAFGGDPERVTVFGESAGAASVGTLLGTPGARGLFRGAIPQSGAASWVSTREQASDIAGRIVERLGVRAGDVDALLATSTDQVLAAQPDFREDGVASLPFQPVVDGVVLDRTPLAAIAAGNAAGVHLLTGTNLTEMTLFTLADPALGALTDDTIRARLVATFGPTSAAVLDDFRTRRPDATPQELWLALSTDGVFRIPAIRLLEAQAPARARVVVPVHLGDPGLRRPPALDPRARDPVRVRHPRPGRGRHAHGHRPRTPGDRRRDAPGLDRVRADRRPAPRGPARLAALRPRAEAHDALRHRVRAARRPRACRPAGLRLRGESVIGRFPARSDILSLTGTDRLPIRTR